MYIAEQRNNEDMKKVFYAALVLLVSCSSPKSDGEQAASQENKCAQAYIEQVQKFETDFVRQFNPGNYTLRSEAVDSYKKELRKIGEKYRQELEEAEARSRTLQVQHAENADYQAKFNEAYSGVFNAELQAQAERLIRQEDDIPGPVLGSIDRIIPPKPDEARIKADMVGHSFGEGFPKSQCFFGDSWRWTVEEGEIKDFKMGEVVEDSETTYTFNASMVLQSGEYVSYDADVEVYYVLPSGQDWKMDLVKSRGVKVVRTGKYDDCIRGEIIYGGLSIRNVSEVQLLVGGYVLTYDGRKTFFTRVPPGQSRGVAGGVNAYEIVFVERE